MSKSRLAMIQLHIAVALFGLAGLLGKATTVSPMMIVLGRTGFGALAFAMLFATGLLKRPEGPMRRLLVLALPGCVLAIHWICFFQAIQRSSVAVALLSYSSFPVFVTIFEPLIFGERRRQIDAVTAGLVLLGLIVMTPSLDLNDSTTEGIAWGLLSGLSFAALLLMNRKLASLYSSAVITAGQCLFAAASLAVLLPTYAQPLALTDWLLLAVLGIVFTALAHFLFIQSLVQIRAQLASVVSALEPIYGGLFAWLLLGEVPAPRTLVGGALILAAIVIGALSDESKSP